MNWYKRNASATNSKDFLIQHDKQERDLAWQQKMQHGKPQPSNSQQPNSQLTDLIDKITPNGDKLKLLFATAQGSIYIMTEKGLTRRNKSVHMNTGGSDSGVHGWNQHAIFVQPQYEAVGNAALYLNNRGFKYTASVGNGKFTYFILDPQLNQWRPATWNDAFPKAVQSGLATAGQLIDFPYVKEPTVGYNILEFNAVGGQIKGVHFGSPVSNVKPIANATVQELQPFALAG